MDIKKNIPVPTGNILIVDGELRKPLECLSLGDYGKDVNIKADFLGLNRKPKAVRHTKLLPLTEKWVITISTQYGCSMGCSFCDVPYVGPGINCTLNDLLRQVYASMDLHREINYCRHLNIHFARMGEPSFNPNVPFAAMALKDQFYKFNIHPVVSTMMPANNKWLEPFIMAWMWVKNEYFGGDAGLQLSINSTSEDERKRMFNGNASPLWKIASMIHTRPRGRKITLNFAVADYEIDPNVLLEYFDPSDYIVKLTPMHKTRKAIMNDIKTDGDYTEYYPYKHYEKSLKDAGYDVLVFIASREEDESRITCGNAILSGTRPFEMDA